MQCSLTPSTACPRLKPSSASQPEPGLSAVARRVNISEIGAAGPLQDVAGDRRHVADLCGGAREDRFRQHREAIAHDRMPRQLTVGDRRADGDRVIRHVDARQPERPDIDNGVWREHIDLHQIDKRRPTSQEHRARAGGHGARRIRRASQPFKGEGLHDRTSFASTCLTAATMFG